MSEKLKAFYLPQSTHEAILDEGRRCPKVRPSEIIERSIKFYRLMHSGGHDVEKYYEEIQSSEQSPIKEEEK